MLTGLNDCHQVLIKEEKKKIAYMHYGGQALSWASQLSLSWLEWG